MKYRAIIVGSGYECQGQTYTGTDAVGKMCRELKEGVLEIFRGDTLSMTVNVSKRATQSLTENDRGMRYVTYKPMPDIFGREPA